MVKGTCCEAADATSALREPAYSPRLQIQQREREMAPETQYEYYDIIGLCLQELGHYGTSFLALRSNGRACVRRNLWRLRR